MDSSCSVYYDFEETQIYEWYNKSVIAWKYNNYKYRNPATSNMKLFASVINCLKTVTYETHMENASIFCIKMIITCFVVDYCYPGVAIHN